MSESEEISRDELYRQVWTLPLSKLAKQLGVPAIQIAGACDDHEIPRPPSGYWMQKARGLPVGEMPPLPKSEQVQIAIRKPRKRMKETDYPVEVVPDRLVSPLPIIAATVQHLRGQEADRNGLVHAGGAEHIRISVSPECIGRAARILNTLLKRMMSEGFAIGAFEEFGKKRFGLIAEEEEYPIRITERLDRIQIPPTKKDIEQAKKWGYTPYSNEERRPKGELVLTVGKDYWNPVIISDSEKGKVEDFLGKLVVRVRNYIANDLMRTRKQREEQAREEQKRNERQRREEEAELQRKQEEKRICKLTSEIQRWKFAADIRAYVAEIRRVIETAGANVPSESPMGRWLKWAESYATNIDPMKSVLTNTDTQRF